MTWWWRSRLGTPVLASAAALIAACILSGSRSIPLLNVVTGTVPAPLAAILPAALAIAVAVALGADVAVESVAVRPVRFFDLNLCLGIVLFCLALCGIAAALCAQDVAFSFARNTAALVGMTMASGTLFGRHAAAITPVLFVLAASLFGLDDDRSVYWWALVLQPPGSAIAILVAATLLAAGAVSIAVIRRRA